MKKIAIDAYYKDNMCHVVGGIFNKWKDEHVSEFIYADVEVGSEYVPGEFYKRELPGILKLLEQVDLNEFDNIIIDGYVYLEQPGYVDSVSKRYVPSCIKRGLGRHLRTALAAHYLSRKSKRMLNIIGVAKSLYGTREEAYGRCYRGQSNKPLYITSLNRHDDLVFPKHPQKMIKQMSGEFRLPTILKEVDSETKRYFREGNK